MTYGPKLSEIKEPPVFRIPPGDNVDMGIAYPLSEDVLALKLLVNGRDLRFTISRAAAASFAGRIAEALAK